MAAVLAEVQAVRSAQHRLRFVAENTVWAADDVGHTRSARFNYHPAVLWTVQMGEGCGPLHLGKWKFNTTTNNGNEKAHQAAQGDWREKHW
ncbi:MAG: hypothetical protein JOZ80_14260 [Acidobacteriaceae bacterium]|nr:hypothetical protein [Acidobacteriaceae bacterium]